jgi:DNA-binding MarR family transcriptional regulator
MEVTFDTVVTRRVIASIPLCGLDHDMSSPALEAERNCLTNQTIRDMLPDMVDSNVERLLAAYPAIFVACHRDHMRTDEAGNPLTEKQASVLDHLDATRPTTLTRLAEHMGVSRSTMSIMVTRLVRAGYVARKPGTDRRSIGLTLTAAGKRIQEENTVLNRKLVGQMFRLMDTAEAARALAGLESLARAAGIMLKRRKRERDR